MASQVVAGIAFVFIFGGALLAMAIASRLPDHHRSGDSRDVIKLGIGMIATLSALVLGLLVATAKGSFDAQTQTINQLATKVIFLDRILGWYGNDTQEARGLLRRSLAITLVHLFPDDGGGSTKLAPGKGRSEMEAVYEKIAALQVANDAQQTLKADAPATTTDLTQARLQLFVAGDTSLPTAFLVVLTAWLTALFFGYGLLAPRNPTLIAVLLVCALSLSGAIFLVLELSQPFEGIVRISSAPLQDAMGHLGEQESPPHPDPPGSR